VAATCSSSEVARIPADLAPGDTWAERFGASGLRVRRIRSADDPSFGVAYGRLWAEFGERGEMETRAVIASRLAWDPARPIGRYRYLYEMLVVEREDEIVALRDHTAIAPADVSGSSVAVLVHLSHVLIEPRWRGQGLAGWLRAFPLQAARECAAAGGGAAARITLVAEMEPPEHADPTTLRRLASYGSAGFRKIDPARAHYAQPDFRTAAAIDASAVQPVPLVLLVRRVGREWEHEIPGAEVRWIVAALYEMFAVHLRAEHMAPLWLIHDALPAADARVDLIPPTQ
jgi:GNAT superfamily N-acetyltransferase